MTCCFQIGAPWSTFSDGAFARGLQAVHCVAPMAHHERAPSDAQLEAFAARVAEGHRIREELEYHATEQASALEATPARIVVESWVPVMHTSIPVITLLQNRRS